ncbi:hypothetical protein DFJ73DRAFT_961153 [Zopfochytrium polystomum]|nr:hypothetical protein DFJ73DRAFT_961153 [Zopfochytrium polystomum]
MIQKKVGDKGLGRMAAKDQGEPVVLQRPMKLPDEIHRQIKAQQDKAGYTHNDVSAASIHVDAKKKDATKVGFVVYRRSGSAALFRRSGACAGAKPAAGGGGKKPANNGTNGKGCGPLVFPRLPTIFDFIRPRRKYYSRAKAPVQGNALSFSAGVKVVKG